jgi:hypothetical protein
VLLLAFWVGQRERAELRLVGGLGYVPLKWVFMRVLRSIFGEMRLVSLFLLLYPTILTDVVFRPSTNFITGI